MENKVANRGLFCSTKRFEGDEAVRTKLTLDFSNVTKDDLVEYAIDSLVIKWQNSIRRKKDASVPVAATYVVPKPGTRASASMSDDEMLAKLAKTMTADEIIAKVRAQLDKK